MVHQIDWEECRSKTREECADVIVKQAYQDTAGCEAKGEQDPETGQFPCYMEDKAGVCLCLEKNRLCRIPCQETAIHERRILMPDTQLTLLNGSGDTTIAWDDSEDESMRELIEEKMKEGWSFFIITPRLGGLLPPKKKPLLSMRQLDQDERSIGLDGAKLVNLLKSGKVRSVERDKEKIETVARAATADDVIGAKAVAVKPKRGG
jgi:hypothetical protein